MWDCPINSIWIFFWPTNFGLNSSPTHPWEWLSRSIFRFLFIVNGQHNIIFGLSNCQIDSILACMIKCWIYREGDLSKNRHDTIRWAGATNCYAKIQLGVEQPTATFLVLFQSTLHSYTDSVGFVFSAINSAARGSTHLLCLPNHLTLSAHSLGALSNILHHLTFFDKCRRVRKGRPFIVCWQTFGRFVIFRLTFIHLIEIRQQLIMRWACTNKYKCETINRFVWRSIRNNLTLKN